MSDIKELGTTVATAVFGMPVVLEVRPVFQTPGEYGEYVSAVYQDSLAQLCRDYLEDV